MRAVFVVAIVLGATAMSPSSAARTLEASDPIAVTALAVMQTAQGFVGVTAEVEATVLKEGSGAVFVDTRPLAQTDMQGSARQASRVAASLLGLNVANYDFLVVFRSDSAVIGGPSAGAVMTLAIATALWNVENPGRPWNLGGRVAATGTVNPDGTVGPVGGVPAKAEAAADAGNRLFLYPAGMETAATLTSRGVVWVEMDSHCQALGIACRPIATVQELIEAATGVRLEQPAAPSPGTADYGTALAPRVAPSVDLLDARIRAVRSRLAADPLPPAFAPAVAAALEAAQGYASQAQAALDDARYYSAATRAFQGHIQAGFAENLTTFYRQGRSGAVVEQAIATCSERLAAARAAVAGLVPQGLHEAYALGAADRRLAEAQRLLDRATEGHRNAIVYDQWVAALQDAAFCAERADTATWWAGLRGLFGAGPSVDLASASGLAMADAQELVTYAAAVLGSAGEAQATLNQALAHQAAGQTAAALLAALEAQVDASAAMQVGTGAAISQATLDAARDHAGRAIAAARAAGAEPFASVAQFELAQDTVDAAQALDSYWTARSLALLAVEGPGAAPRIVADAGLDERHANAILLAMMAAFGVVALGVALAVLVVARRP